MNLTNDFNLFREGTLLIEILHDIYLWNVDYYMWTVD